MSLNNFRELLNEETENITLIRDKWTKILQENKNLPEEVTGSIQSAIGKSTMLLQEKCNQFTNLIDQCENGSSEKVISINDLAGYWDTVDLQFLDLKKKFEELEMLRKNKWRDCGESRSTERKTEKPCISYEEDKRKKHGGEKAKQTNDETNENLDGEFDMNEFGDDDKKTPRTFFIKTDP